MKNRKLRILALLLVVSLLLGACGTYNPAQAWQTEGESWHVGFGKRQIIPPEDSGQPLYIAGYNNGWEIFGVLDYCEARAVWLDTGSEGILLIGVDCVALASGTVAKIRQGLTDVANCRAIHVYATHDHAGIDTLGLWGPVGVDGKNDAYMDALVTAAVEAGREAAGTVKAGALSFGQVETEEMLYDSRYPLVYDPNLYQLRFAPSDGSAGLRLYFYGAHAESLRGANSLLSRDFPGLLCDTVTEKTGDNTMFCPGAIGGLIMTDEFVYDTGANAQKNLAITAEKLVDYALQITPDAERQLPARLSVSGTVFTAPMDNPAFMLYKFLGILDNTAVKAKSATGYGVKTELSLVMLGDVALALLPGEIFPELVYGGEYGDANPDGVNPPPLKDIAAEYGIENLLVVGLANDEIGYIVPPSDFLVHEELPYLERIHDYKGENHYEETNSVGPAAADAIARAFTQAAEKLK